MAATIDIDLARISATAPTPSITPAIVTIYDRTRAWLISDLGGGLIPQCIEAKKQMRGNLICH